MDERHSSSPQLRKTRFVLISDTHNQTPKLPKGDVLIHAGDLTNQGSYSELKKTVQWLEKTDFEAKIVIAGNHDTTLDEPFYHKNCASFKWPKPQDPQACRSLLTESTSITYLENQAATMFLNSSSGPQTCFKVFGSPSTPNNRNWAFKYQGHEEASKLWNTIPSDTDIVITHTPPKGHCDGDGKDGRFGCDVLLQALHRVRPMLAVCGHIHEARGVERLHWNLDSPDDEGLVEGVDIWKDPGMGNNKQSLRDVESVETRAERRETCVINAAFMPLRTAGPKTFNKPIVVDVDLPVWGRDGDGNAQ
ncbi:ser/Thr protein phosphatase [Lophiotrema nucula]|uniref:Ser/Thr protein phosphatase n=1 Tax=Lophiotrema nucula TaxID=690887 RepID=A0A6A5Z4S0_9PLEO|nr:ser/Thr protein phosphatase [Lophiotrema nucula]